MDAYLILWTVLMILLFMMPIIVIFIVIHGLPMRMKILEEKTSTIRQGVEKFINNINELIELEINKRKKSQ
jgi:ABC-type transport system involved in cytochrome bd biosynthesis fused ATPase/permease subunit